MQCLTNIINKTPPAFLCVQFNYMGVQVIEEVTLDLVHSKRIFWILVFLEPFIFCSRKYNFFYFANSWILRNEEERSEKG